MEVGSREVCKAAIQIALTDSREEEIEMKAKNKENGILSVAVDFGSDFGSAVPKVLERAVVAAKRENVISSTHAEEGAVAGAAHEAIQQIVDKCVGLNLGGKIGIARHGSHIGVCVVRAIRGATTVENNDREEIIEATKEMLETIISENNIKTEDMVSVIFTITPDLDKVFPAVAARKMGIVDVPLLDMSEPEIDGALKKCIRILMHINSDKQNKDMVHAYLRGATVLRPDLVK